MLKHGSPPRAWGQCTFVYGFLHRRRFTPTGVGTMSSYSRSTSPSSVHPHGRGDNRILKLRQTPCAGSPPRAWGQCLARSGDAENTRFTPTGVGTMALMRATCRLLTVHPHGRGDNFFANKSSNLVNGSPPRAWGQFQMPRNLARCVRFTPTGVGTMLRRCRLFPRCAVHPHGRGDNFVSESPATA